MAKFHNPHTVLQTYNQKQSFVINRQHQNSLFKLQTLIIVKETAVLRTRWEVTLLKPWFSSNKNPQFNTKTSVGENFVAITSERSSVSFCVQQSSLHSCSQHRQKGRWFQLISVLFSKVRRKCPLESSSNQRSGMQEGLMTIFRASNTYPQLT